MRRLLDAMLGFPKIREFKDQVFLSQRFAVAAARLPAYAPIPMAGGKAGAKIDELRLVVLREADHDCGQDLLADLDSQIGDVLPGEVYRGFWNSGGGWAIHRSDGAFATVLK